MNRQELARRLALYLVADDEQCKNDTLLDVQNAIIGGVTCVQQRTKHMSDLLMWRIARILCRECREQNALFIVNDRVDIALSVGADGVHLGVHDMPIQAVRELAGPDFIIGYSPEDDEDAADAVNRGADYLGIGPVYGTKSKDDAGAPIGLEILRRRVRNAGIPVIGIGGINARRAGAVIETGAVGVAVVSAILHAHDVLEASSELSSVVQSALRRRR